MMICIDTRTGVDRSGLAEPSFICKANCVMLMRYNVSVILSRRMLCIEGSWRGQGAPGLDRSGLAEPDNSYFASLLLLVNIDNLISGTE